MKKNIINRIKAVIAAAGLISAGLFAISCDSELLQNPKEDKVAYIVPVVNTDASRTVFPTTNVEELKTISLSYTDTTTKVYAIWDTYKDFKDAVIALETGTKYTLTLEAFQGGAKFQAATVVTPVAGENTVAFNLAVVKYGEKEGSIDLTAKFPKATNVNTSNVKLLKVNSDGTTSSFYEKNNVTVESLKDGTQYIKLSRERVPAGIYKFEMSVTDVKNQTGFVSDYVYVYEGCASANAYDLKFADIYTLASGVYESSSEHIEATPDPDGKGVKIVLKAPAGDYPWTWAQVISSRTQVGMNIDSKILPKVGQTSTVVYFPFGTDGEIDIFTLKFSRDKDGDGNGEIYTEEKVISDSNGGDISLFNHTSSNVYNDAKITLSTTGANIKVSEDITTFLAEDKINREYLDEVLINLCVRSGHTDWSDNTEDVYYSSSNAAEWYEHASWSGSFSKENYKKMRSSDGFNLYDATALEKLANHKTWWATLNVGFRLKNGDTNYFTVDVSSDETVYTPLKLNKYNFVLNTKDIKDFSNSYEDGTKVILPDFVDADYKLLGWYDNKNFTGTPVTEVSAASNTGNKTFYGKVARVFNFNQWEDSETHVSSYNYMIMCDFALANSKVTKTTAGQKIKITLSGVPNYTIENKEMDVAFGHWDFEKVNNDGTKGNFGDNTVYESGKNFTFTKGQESKCEFVLDAKDYTVKKDSIIWFFIPKEIYDEKELVYLQDFKVSVEVVE